ncbi:MAG: ferritin [Acidobacteria bacterium]|nr:ferritin [Acidobacteriota bacterium]
MIQEKIQDALNNQVAAEFYSAHLYLSMSSYLESIDLPGAANWMRIQYREELAHAEKIFDFVIERDGRAILEGFDAPPREWSSALGVFQAAYEHEQKVTAMIEKLVELARELKDYATEVFLQWFISEQVEEEASVKAIVQQLKLVAESKNGRFMIDRELASRTFAPSSGA